jgi:hypothetical protein
MVPVRASAPLGKGSRQAGQGRHVIMIARTRRGCARWQNIFDHVKLHRLKVTDFCRSATDDTYEIAAHRAEAVQLWQKYARGQPSGLGIIAR